MTELAQYPGHCRAVVGDQPESQGVHEMKLAVGFGGRDGADVGQPCGSVGKPVGADAAGEVPRGGRAARVPARDQGPPVVVTHIPSAACSARGRIGPTRCAAGSAP